MNYILFDDAAIRPHLLPLAFTRPTAEMRVGIQTISKKWEGYLKESISYLTAAYLQTKYPCKHAPDSIYINGAVCPSDALVRAVIALQMGEGLEKEGTLLAYRKADPLEDIADIAVNTFEGEVRIIRHVTDIFTHNGEQLRADFARITRGRTSEPITDRFTAYYNESQIFIEEGANIKAASLNAENGPIYIGKNVTIMEGTHIQGPFAILEGSAVNVGGKMRPNTTIGPSCKVGGEINNAVMFANSNKGHEGFMGNAVIGEWCNWGADTNNSNLKNDYTKVELWSYATNRYENTGLQFVGIIMGDHSKCGINTMFNTGTVVGVNCNIFGAEFQARHIPSFSWGGGETFKTYHIRKANQVARAVFERRGKTFDEVEENILKEVFQLTHLS